MDNARKGSAFARLKPTKRRIIQLYAALLYNAQLKGFVNGQIYTGALKNLCVPGLNCYSCPGAIGACPLGALQNALASTTTRTPAYIFGIIMLLGLGLGRTICGFLCPFGLVQELLYKIPSVKLKKSRVTRAISWLKYVILAAFVVAVPLWYAVQHFPVPAFCKYICPAGTLEGAIGLLSNPNNVNKLSMLGVLFTRKFVIMVLVLTAAVFIYRVFCRFLCPLGAIYGLFCKVALVGVQVDAEKCIDCEACVRKCKMDVSHVGDHECIHCGECAAHCPTKAIAWHAGTKRLETGREKPVWKKAVLPLAAIVLLVGVMWYVNTPDVVPEREMEKQPAVTAQPAELPAEPSATPVYKTGNEPGMLLPDFKVAGYSGETYSTVEQRGKVCVINFWATWCTPCVNELPYFEAIAAQYGDSASVIAIHSALVTEDVQAWLERENYAMDFALDETGDVIKSLGGSTVLPMTVVVDADGIITYNAEGSVSYEKLKALVEEAQK